MSLQVFYGFDGLDPLSSFDLWTAPLQVQVQVQARQWKWSSSVFSCDPFKRKLCGSISKWCISGVAIQYSKFRQRFVSFCVSNDPFELIFRRHFLIFCQKSSHPGAIVWLFPSSFHYLPSRTPDAMWYESRNLKTCLLYVNNFMSNKNETINLNVSFPVMSALKFCEIQTLFRFVCKE